MVVMEAYTSFENTMLYYDYNVLPFNFMFIVNITSKSTPQDYKREIDLWMNAMPNGEVANWVVRVLLLMQISCFQIDCTIFLTFIEFFNYSNRSFKKFRIYLRNYLCNKYFMYCTIFKYKCKYSFIQNNSKKKVFFICIVCVSFSNCKKQINIHNRSHEFYR
jgi:hypothetical protein